MSGDPSRVRVADERDEDELMRLCVSLWEENGLFPMDEYKVRDMLRGAISGPVAQRRGIVGVIGPRGAIEGSIFLEVGSLWYTSAITLNEAWNFVPKQYRSSSNSTDLIAFAKMCADKFGIPLLIGVLSNERTAAKVRLYRKALGEPAGAFFLHGCVSGQGGVH
jgi:hypothetical protein